MKRITLLCSALLLCLTLTACREGNANALNGVEDQLLQQQQTARDVIVRSDAEGLLEVYIENGTAGVRIHAARFEELYNYSERYGEMLFDGNLPIEGLSGKVKDACIAQIPKIDFLNGTDFVSPSIFLLMEDGSVEWVPFEFFSQGYETPELYSWGPLMWIKNIVSLSDEIDGEGMGEMTVFGSDQAGTRYDLCIPVSFMELCNGSWACSLDGAGNSLDSDGYYAVLTFSQDGAVTFESGWMDGSEIARYTGSYTLSIAENAEVRPGILTLDLQLDSNSQAKKPPKRIQGSYFADMYGMVMLSLWHADGDLLYADGQGAFTNGEFWLSYNPLDMQSYAYRAQNSVLRDDYAQYLTSNVSQADEMVRQHGMSILVTDEYTELSGRQYRHIWLGTDHPDQFVREILYAISDDGRIAAYDPVLDKWSMQ